MPSLPSSSCAISSHVKGAFNPTVHVTNKDVKQCRSKHWPLWSATCYLDNELWATTLGMGQSTQFLVHWVVQGKIKLKQIQAFVSWLLCYCYLSWDRIGSSKRTYTVRPRKELWPLMNNGKFICMWLHFHSYQNNTLNLLRHLHPFPSRKLA